MALNFSITSTVIPFTTPETLILSSSLILTTLTDVFGIYIKSALLCIGLPANVLSFFVFNHPSFRKSTSSFFLRMLAISDSIYVLRIATYDAVASSPEILMNQAGYIFCIFSLYWWKFALATSRNLVVVVTWERAIAIAFPLKSKQFLTQRNARIVYFIVIILSIAESVPFTWFFKNNTPLTNTIAGCPYDLNWSLVLPLSDIVFILTIILIVLLILANLVIVVCLFIRSGERRKLTTSDSNKTATDNEIKRVTLAVCLIGVWYLLAFTTDAIYDIVNSRKPKWFTDNPEAVVLYYNIGRCLEVSNFCINLFMYGLTSRKVRGIALNCFMCRKDKQKGSTIATRTSV